MMSRVRGTSVLACVGVGLLVGCHRYVPVETAPVGSVVRVHVPVTSALVGRSAAQRTESIEGLLVDGGDTLTLATQSTVLLGAHRELIRHDTIRLAASQTTALEVREFSTGRSIALGVAIAGAAAYSAAVAFGLGGGSTGGDDDPGNGTSASVLAARALAAAVWGLFAR